MAIAGRRLVSVNVGMPRALDAWACAALEQTADGGFRAADPRCR
jgi:hypothetical protein